MQMRVQMRVQMSDADVGAGGRGRAYGGPGALSHPLRSVASITSPDHRSTDMAGEHARRAATIPSGGVYLRRRLVAVGLLVAVVFALGVVVGAAGADAELTDRVAGEAVVEPGSTLWDVAVESSPPGSDPREQLARIKELNHLDGSSVEAWTVVLLPAR